MTTIWKSFGGRLVLGLLVLLPLVALATLRVRRTLHPPRQPQEQLDFASMRLDVETVTFLSVDGLRLAGWLLPGDPTVSPILLCHDLGSSRSSLINLALALNTEGFSVLLFDFRAHGASEGRHSTLGLEERRDVLGAVDFLEQRREIDGSSIGIYGVGMGAHAAVLAAEKRSQLRVLVLDGLYPDAAYPLVRGFYGGWELGVRRLGAIPASLYAVMNGTGVGAERAAEVLAHLHGRDVLLLAPAGDDGLAQEIRRMYEALPAQSDVDGNMLVLPATHSEGLYGAALDRHHARVVEFFRLRLLQH